MNYTEFSKKYKDCGTLIIGTDYSQEKGYYDFWRNKAEITDETKAYLIENDIKIDDFEKCLIADYKAYMKESCVSRSPKSSTFLNFSFTVTYEGNQPIFTRN